MAHSATGAPLLGVGGGRGGCRHPDGAVRLVGDYLGMLAEDAATPTRGETSAHDNKSTCLRIPRPIAL
jgi:hypothetical protein